MINSYVTLPSGDVVNVSTINRDSSALDGGRYAETIVWEWHNKERMRGSVLHMDSAPEGSIKKHLQICEQFHSTGEVSA